jgi:hypothetical protein
MDAKHCTVVAEDHEVVAHELEPMETVGVTVPGPKLRPEIVTVMPVDSGAFCAIDVDKTGASYVKVPVKVPAV